MPLTHPASPPDDSAPTSSACAGCGPDPRAAYAADTAVRMLFTATVAGLLLIPIRAKTVGFWLWPTVQDWRGELPTALMTACYDVAFVAGTALVFGALLLPWARRIVSPGAVYWMHLTFSVITLINGLANISVIPWLGQPFNFQWLYYSDFLRSPDAISSILATAPPWKMGLTLLGAVSFVAGVAWIGARVARALQTRRRRLIALTTLVALSSTYLAVSFQWRHRADWNQDILANPVWAFAESCLRALRTPPLLLIDTPYQADSFLPPPATPDSSWLPADGPRPRHVIIFVLESVAAQYVGLYGAPYGVTPILDSQRSRAAVFTHAYAHAPATNLTLLSLMTGRHPRVSFRPVTAANPTIAVPHLSALLRNHGFATGFFSSASLQFQRADEFLAASGGFERIEDDSGRPEAAVEALSQWRDFVGTDDNSTVESLIAWAGSKGDQPIFGILWTAQSHYPYYAPTEAPRITEGSEQFNRYLHAVADGDRALGKLLSWLDETGRADDTLVVVLGDHGQAFGQHQTFGHAGHTWEEHLRIPLVLINRRLFSGQTFETIAGVADIAPTLTEVLRLPELPGYQGRSLFRRDRSNTLYFFAGWSDFLVGYREGDMKVVYNMTKDTYRIHNLANDPGEVENLAGNLPDVTAEARLKLAGWMQYVESTYVEAEAVPAAAGASD